MLWPAALALTIFLASSRTRLAAPVISFDLALTPDKIAHFLVYGLLATAVLRLSTFRKQAWAGLGWTVFLVSAYGMSDELHQLLTPGRSFELADWLADTIGAGVAGLLYLKCRPYRNLLEHKPQAKRTTSPNCPLPDGKFIEETAS